VAGLQRRSCVELESSGQQFLCERPAPISVVKRDVHHAVVVGGQLDVTAHKGCNARWL